MSEEDTLRKFSVAVSQKAKDNLKQLAQDNNLTQNEAITIILETAQGDALRRAINRYRVKKMVEIFGTEELRDLVENLSPDMREEMRKALDEQ